MLQPRLMTRRLVLVPLAPEHLPYQVELNSDPAVARYLVPRVLTVAEIEQLHERWLARGAVGDGRGVWAGFDGSDFVGVWQLQQAFGRPSGDMLPDQAELGYRLLRRYWRQGYASEGSRELLRYGFENLGLRRIVAHTMAVNEASRATMASVGLTFVEAFTEEFDELVEGHERGEVEYALVREEWLQGTEKH